MGKQWLIGSKDNVVFDIFLGSSYYTTTLTVTSGNDADYEFGGFDIRFGVNFGKLKKSPSTTLD